MRHPPPISTLFPYTTLFRSQLAYEKGMYILTAAQSYQAALEAAQLGHGLLTYALVEEGLKKGEADPPSSHDGQIVVRDRKSTRLNSSHRCISYAVFCLKKKK